MNRRPFRLKRSITLTLLVKVLALTLLWWFVVRDHRTHPDPQSVETHFLAVTSPSPSTATPEPRDDSNALTRGTPR